MRSSVSAVGSSTVAYQWRYNGSDIPDATNNVLVLTNLQAQHAGTYSAVVSNAGGAIPSRDATLVVNPSAPEITGNLSNAAVITGGEALFRITAIGSEPLTYEWWFNRIKIAGYYKRCV